MAMSKYTEFCARTLIKWFETTMAIVKCDSEIFFQDEDGRSWRQWRWQFNDAIILTSWQIKMSTPTKRWQIDSNFYDCVCIFFQKNSRFYTKNCIGVFKRSVFYSTKKSLMCFNWTIMCKKSVHQFYFTWWKASNTINAFFEQPKTTRQPNKWATI